MAGRSVSAAMVLGFLMVAGLCLQAQADGSKSSDLDDLEVKLHNKCEHDARLVLVGVGKHLDCKKGGLEVLGPLKLKLQVKGLLKLHLFVFGKGGKLLKLKIAVKLNLKLVGKLVDLVLVEEVLGGEFKLLKLFLGVKLIGEVKLPIVLLH